MPFTLEQIKNFAERMANYTVDQQPRYLLLDQTTGLATKPRFETEAEAIAARGPTELVLALRIAYSMNESEGGWVNQNGEPCLTSITFENNNTLRFTLRDGTDIVAGQHNLEMYFVVKDV